MYKKFLNTVMKFIKSLSKEDLMIIGLVIGILVLYFRRKKEGFNNIKEANKNFDVELVKKKNIDIFIVSTKPGSSNYTLQNQNDKNAVFVNKNRGGWEKMRLEHRNGGTYIVSLKNNHVLQHSDRSHEAIFGNQNRGGWEKMKLIIKNNLNNVYIQSQTKHGGQKNFHNLQIEDGARNGRFSNPNFGSWERFKIEIPNTEHNRNMKKQLITENAKKLFNEQNKKGIENAFFVLFKTPIKNG